MAHLVGFFLCALLSIVLADEQKKTVTVISFGKCAVGPGGKEIDYNVNMHGEGENKYVTLEAKPNDEINDKYTYRGNVLAHNGKTYVHYMDANGNLCKSIDDHAKEAFKRLKNNMVPALTEPCQVPPGEYKLDKFTLAKDEAMVPIPSTGTFKVELHVYDLSGVERACIVAELLIEVDDNASSEEH